MSRTKKIVLRVVGVIVVVYLALVIGRMVHVYNQGKTDEVVAKIHATKLTLDDVMGKNLPATPAVALAKEGQPDPSDAAIKAYYDATVEGVDANKNGIRDDVELAIFKTYPNSAKTRAVLLQYALALQMEVTQPVVNRETVIAVAQDRSRASACIGQITPRTDMQKFITATQKLTDFIKTKQINTKERDITQVNFYKNIGSYSDIDGTCDIDPTTLPN